jgi:hypothetical protein
VAQKRKTLKARLQQEIERARNPPHDLSDVLTKTTPIDYSDKRTREIGANIALTLSNRAIDAPLRMAFEEFGLDPLDPVDWRILLQSLSGIHFSPPTPRNAAPRGARPKWDEHRRRLFEFHVARARKETKRILNEHGEPGPTHSDIALYLNMAWHGLYGNISRPTLRKYIVSGPPRGRR